MDGFFAPFIFRLHPYLIAPNFIRVHASASKRVSLTQCFANGFFIRPHVVLQHRCYNWLGFIPPCLLFHNWYMFAVQCTICPLHCTLPFGKNHCKN